MEHPSDARPAAALLHLLGFGGPAEAGGFGAARDWPAVASTAARTGLAPLLYRRLAEAEGRRGPPPEILAALRSSYLRTLGVNLRAREQIAQILAALAAAGIPAVLLKGAHLAHGVYEDPATRAMSDLDLLVAPDRVPDAAARLRSLGYSPSAGYTLAAERAHRAHLPPFFAPGKLPVELHWRLLRPTEPYHPDTGALMERSRPLPALGPAAFVLDPADAFLHLALHAIVNDRLAGAPRTLVDLSSLIAASRDDPSWSAAARRAREAGAARVHDLALALLAIFPPARALAPERVPGPPPPAWAEAAPEAAVLELALALALDAPGPEGAITPNLAQAFSGSPRAATRLLAARMFPSSSEMGALEPGPGGAAARLLRYPRRWAALLARHGPAAWRLLRGDAPERELARTIERSRELAAWCAGGAAPAASKERGTRPDQRGPAPAGSER